MYAFGNAKMDYFDQQLALVIRHHQIAWLQIAVRTLYALADQFNSELLGVPESNIKRDTRAAKAFLQRELTR